MQWRWGLLLILLAPWLIPPQGGPSPSLVPMLLSLAGMGLMLSCMPLLVRGVTRTDLAAMVAGAWLTAALVSSVIGLFQYFGVAHFNVLMSPAEAGEAYGNLRQRNQFATLTNIGLMAAAWWVARPSGSHPCRWQPWMQHGAAILLSIGNAASLSRTGLMQLLLIAGLVVLWSASNERVRRVLLTALFAYALAAWALPMLRGQESGAGNIYSRFQPVGDVCTSRLTLWRNVWTLVEQRPWLGWGWGELDFAHFIAVYDGTRFCDILDNAHNLPLHLAVELGLPFAALICSVFAGLIWRAQPWREKDWNRRLAWGGGALLLLHSMVEYPLWYGPFQMALALCLGLLLWPESESSEQKVAGKMQHRTPYWLMIVGGGLLVTSAYAAWDYYRVSQIFYPPDFRAAAYRDNTIEKIRGTWLFQDQVQFAEFTLTPLTPGNAEYLYKMGQRVLHYSPEARVVEKLIECAVLLGRNEAVRLYLARYKAAFPKEHARWAAKQLEPLPPQ